MFLLDLTKEVISTLVSVAGGTSTALIIDSTPHPRAVAGWGGASTGRDKAGQL